MGSGVRWGGVVDTLCGGGAQITVVCWPIGEDLHGLAGVHGSVGGGQALAIAIRNIRVWGKRQSALERAARRTEGADVEPLLRALAKLDALAKGLGRGDAGDAVAAIALELCGPSIPVEP